MATAKHGLFSFGNWDFNITESHVLKSDGAVMGQILR